MDVEIYDERELDSSTFKPECDTEALQLIEELGLTQQKGENGKRLAYPQPTADQGFIIGALFTQATKLENYSAGSIPLRILKEIRSYKAENPGHLLLVRHCAPAQVKDPILLAFTGGYTWMWDQSATWTDFRLVARWGDALDSWENLMVQAQKVAATKALLALNLIIRKATSMRESIDATRTWPSNDVPTLSNLPAGW